MEKTAELDALSARNAPIADLVVDPADIWLQDIDGESLMIRVRVRNQGRRRTKATVLRLESAPLGAFVPWRPLTELPVPALKPGESRELTAVMREDRRIALGSFEQVTPGDLLKATDAFPAEQLPQQVTGLATMFNLLRGRTAPEIQDPIPPLSTPLLAPDLWELAGRAQPHWAGNIHAFVGGREVERHQARALRMHPGQPNLALFIVGDPGKADAYSFEIAGLTPEWRAALYDVTKEKTLVVRSSDAPIREMDWVETDGAMVVVLAVRPPDDCEEGNVEIRVTQRSQQKTAVVEFQLDATAQGTGCYPA